MEAVWLPSFTLLATNYSTLPLPCFIYTQVVQRPLIRDSDPTAVYITQRGGGARQAPST